MQHGEVERECKSAEIVELKLSKFLKENYQNHIRLLTPDSQIRAPYLVAYIDSGNHSCNPAEIKPLTDLLYAVAIEFRQLRYAVQLVEVRKKGQQLPSLCMVSEQGNKCHFRKELNLSEVTLFCKDFLKSIKFQSDPVPAVNTTCLVKKVVALNFDELILENPKDVFVVFHWTSRFFLSNGLQSLERVAQWLHASGDLKSDIDVLRMNVSTNTLPRKWLPDQKLPLFIYIKRQNKTHLIAFDNNDNTKTFSDEKLLQFVARHSTKELNYCNRYGIKKNY